MRAKVANALSREIQLIATPVVGGLIQPERLLLGILATTMGRQIEWYVVYYFPAIIYVSLVSIRQYGNTHILQ